VLRVIVQPGEGFVGDGRLKGKTVTVPAGDGPGGWSGEQDINVDLRDVQRYDDAQASRRVRQVPTSAFEGVRPSRTKRVLILGLL